jgi:spore coat polysaccharide biosynthesis protein SpsF (cytidylyltransferase family)
MMTTVAIVQARLGSTRLPDKVLMELCGKPMLQHIIERVRRSKTVGEVVVATTTSVRDDALASFAAGRLGVPLVRGSENNVLERFIMASRAYPSEIIVRITADDPLKDPSIIDLCVNELLRDKRLDYCSNTIVPTYPEGLDIEAFRTVALERVYREARLDSEREHVTPYIWNHPEIFATKNLTYTENLSAWRWTVDKPRDFELMTEIFGHFRDRGNDFSYREVIEFLKTRPDLVAHNQHTARNEGYQKSIQGEKNG